MNKLKIAKSQLTSTILTLFVIGFLLIVGTVSAINLSILTSDFSVYENDVAEFEVGVVINDAERPNPVFMLELNSLEDNITCTFSDDGGKVNFIDCDQDQIRISKTSEADLLGYGYGYGYNVKDYGYGYGYGYGYQDEGNNEFKFIVEWHTPLVDENKTYNIVFSALDSKNKLFVSEDSLLITVMPRLENPITTLSRSSGGGGSGFSSFVSQVENEEQEEPKEQENEGQESEGQENQDNVQDDSSISSTSPTDNLQVGDSDNGQEEESESSLIKGGLITGNVPTVAGFLIGLLIIGGLAFWGIRKNK